jgi:AraC family transcriptional regulator
MQRRIEVARKMLLQTGHDLAFIAQETGFSSQSHFTRLFRVQTGHTPARFREHR